MTPSNSGLNQVLKKRVKTLAHPLDPLPTHIEPHINSLPSVKAVLLDVYGTLLAADSGEVGTESKSDRGNRVFEETLHALDLSADLEAAPHHPFKLLMDTIRRQRQQLSSRGVDVPEVDIREVWGSVFQELEASNIVTQRVSDDRDLIHKIGVEFELRFNPCWPMPGTKKLLKFLKNEDKVMGIISNSQFYTPLSLEALLDDSLTNLGFTDSLLFWSYEHHRAKPDLDFYRPAVQRLHHDFKIRAEETLYVGNDMLNDIYPADQLGMQTALFAGDKRSLRLREDDERVSGVEPTLIVTELEQLAECV